MHNIEGHAMPDTSFNYTIQVKGRLTEERSSWFDDMTITYADGTTTISGPIADQAALHGLLARIRDLGLSLIDVTRADDPDSGLPQ